MLGIFLVVIVVRIHFNTKGYENKFYNDLVDIGLLFLYNQLNQISLVILCILKGGTIL